jgi:hypothetical protein
MRWRTLLSLAMLGVTATSIEAARRRATGEDLLQVVAPTSRAVASAHPIVNAIVTFGAAADGTPADPSTFRAKLNGRDVSGDFLPTLGPDGAQTGLHAALPSRMLRLTSTPHNRLRLSIQGERSAGKGPRPRDVDRLRFGAADTPNRPPVVLLAVGSETATAGSPVAFDASGSHDPDLDELAFTWTFSDGGTATGPTTSHAFATVPGGGVSATVTVSDGVTSAAATATLPTGLTADPGRTPGILRIESTTGLEFSAVALGGSATRSLTIRNTDATATSQVKVQALVDHAAFVVGPGTLDLGPQESAVLDVTFAPTAAGHAGARVTLLASASNRSAVILLAHGYGGAAPGDGPTLLAVPVYATLGGDLTRIAPDGTQLPLDVTTGTCAPPGASGTGDACLVDADCATGGEVCAATATALDASELCSDGQSLFVLSENSFTDQRPDPDTELSGSLVRFDLDANGATTGRRVLYRTTDETSTLACDGFGADTGGLVYLAEFHNVADTAACSRDERDALVTVNKATGTARTAGGFSRIDQAVGVGDCDFRDAVEHLEVAADGTKKFAGFDLHGLWRIAPTPLAFTPDVRDGFRVHPDGSIAFAIAHDRGTTGTVDLYRLTDDDVEHGALPVSAIAPCASFAVPNDASAADPATTRVASIVVGPAAVGGTDATALVTFVVRPATPAIDVLPPFGDLRGTVAFSLPAGTTECGIMGLVSLQSGELSR